MKCIITYNPAHLYTREPERIVPMKLQSSDPTAHVLEAGIVLAANMHGGLVVVWDDGMITGYSPKEMHARWQATHNRDDDPCDTAALIADDLRAEVHGV